jgi:hypothetical protein
MLQQGPDNASVPPARQVRLLVADYANCIIKREASLAREVLLAGDEDRELMARYPKLVQDTCLSTKLGDQVVLSFRDDEYRYALADALVRRDLAEVVPPDLAELPALKHGTERADPSTLAGASLSGRSLQKAAADYNKWRTGQYMWRFGECVVRVDPEGSKRLLMSPIESSAESAGFTSLGTALGTCLGEGRQLEFGKVALRGTIAVNYYRLVTAALPQTAGAARS